ncbi:MAG: hypothetical protein JWO87_2274, partial [Phycisphaerales bacterium]|nr:hypothetical protein [Phycisphaerales bacterium]
ARNRGEGQEGIALDLPGIACGVIFNDGSVWIGGESRNVRSGIRLESLTRGYSFLVARHSFAGFGVASEHGARLLQIPCWFAAFVSGLCGVLGLAFWRIRMPGCCTHCGYDLRATPERCPECSSVPPNVEVKA